MVSEMQQDGALAQFSSAPDSELKRILSSLDRKKYRVEKVEENGKTMWTAIRLRRKGLYRTAIKDEIATQIGYRTQAGSFLNTDLSSLEFVNA